MSIHRTLFLSALLALPTSALSAHHSGARFDSARTVPLSGVISKLSLVNPHVSIAIDVRTSDGKVTTWTIEMAAPGALKKRNFDMKVLTVGHQVTVECWLAKGEEKWASGRVLITSDGKRLDIHDVWFDMPNLPR